MRIRTQLLVSAALAGLLSVVVAAGLIYVTRQAQAGMDEQGEAQEVVRGVANMLALTNEFSVYGSERAAAQWRTRHSQLAISIDSAMRRHTAPLAPLVELRRDVNDLLPLFEALVLIGHDPPDTLSQRRRELLLERLLTETQEVVESRHRWALAVSDAQRRDQAVYTVMVLSAPVALLLLGASFLLLVSRRVLKPLAQLQAAVTAIRAGDLTVRCASDEQDELGDTARAVDAMTLALQQQSTALKESETRLKLITDTLPARVAYVDAGERYRFVNAHFARAGGESAESMLGRTLREVRGDDIYQLLAPYVARALSGDSVSFETTRNENQRISHRQSTYVPDLDADGRVRGFFALTFDITDRKEAELRLAASERLLIDIADNVPALVAYIDRDHCFGFANCRYRDWLGTDPERMIGRHISDAVGADFYGMVRPNLEMALAGKRVRWERQSTRYGQTVYYLTEYIPDIAPDGSVRGCYALTIDITERRLAEVAIARSEQRLTDLTNNIPALVGYFDMEGHCLYANDTALTSLGLERDQLSTITLREALGETNFTQHEPYVKGALAGQRARFTGKISYPGRDAHFQAHLIPDRIEGGAQRGFYLMTFDITALKEAEQRRASVERQLRAITDNLPVLISYIDHEERIHFLNDTYRKWLGIDPALLIGKTMQEASGPDHYEQRSGYLQLALQGQRVEFELESQTLDSVRSLQNVYIPDIQSDGSVAGVYTLSTDVSALKQVEVQLRELARVDALTGLANRRRFEEQMVEAISRASRASKPLALMFLDVDRFKSINDELGHSMGDAVLKEFAHRLRGAVRLTDMPARLAGDEFVILLEGLHAEHEAELVAEKVVAAIRRPFELHGVTVNVTTSVGVAYCQRPSPESAILDAADEALYEAKRAGRNTYRSRHVDGMTTASFGSLESLASKRAAR